MKKRKRKRSQPISQDELIGRNVKARASVKRYVERHELNPSGPLETALTDSTNEFILSLFEPLIDDTDPKELMRRTFKSMEKLDDRVFALNNLLEAIKRGAAPGEALEGLSKLGLISVPEAAFVKNQVSEQTDESRSAPLIRKLINRLKGALLRLGQVMANCLEAFSENFEFKPHIGFVGPVPMVSFEIEGGITLAQLIDAF